MQSIKLNDKQSRELCDEIGNLLAVQLDSEVIRNKVNRLAADYVKRNDLNADAADIAKNISWSVKVSLKR
jgi:hypothetical protein